MIKLAAAADLETQLSTTKILLFHVDIHGRVIRNVNLPTSCSAISV
jgi:hypothetical protein